MPDLRRILASLFNDDTESKKQAVNNRRMEMKRYHLLFLAVCSLFLAPSAARAQAFGLNEIGSCAFARGFSATSAPCNDASSIFWNPAALAGMKGNSMLLGGAAIKVGAKFTRDSAQGEHEADVPLALVPHLFLNRAMSERMAVGIGVYVPYGLTSQWEDDFPGRFLAKKASIGTIYFQPNVAYSFKGGTWKVGGGPVIGHSTVELIQAADLADQIARVDSTTVPTTRNVIRFSQLGIAKRTEFSRATLEGSATSFGLNIGVLGKLTNNWTMGARYLSSLMMDYDGADATFKPTATGIVFAANNPLGYPAGTLFDTLALVRARYCTAAGDALPAAAGPTNGAAGTCAAKGLLGAQTVSTRIAHPDQFQIGFAYTGFANWLIAVDYEWTGWKKFTNLPVDFANDSIATVCSASIAATVNPCDFDVLDRDLYEDYNNTSAIRIGAERTLKSGWIVRAGFSGVAAAAPDETVTPLVPEQDRTYWSLGSEFPLVKDKITLDAAYGFVLGSGRRGRIDERLSRTQTGLQLNSGVYDLSAHVLSFSVKASF
jgi:long-chain fatty acid transport protein